MPDLHQFNPSFKPLLLPGHTARLFKADGVVDVLCTAVEALPSYRHDFGQVAADGSSLGNDVSQLDVDNGQMAQFRYIIDSDIEIEFSHPSGTTTLWRTQTQRFRARPFTLSPAAEPQEITAFRWAATEFFVYEQETPRFDAYSTHQVQEAYVEFMGFKFYLQPLPSGQEGLLKLWVNAYPTGKR